MQGKFMYHPFALCTLVRKYFMAFSGFKTLISVEELNQGIGSEDWVIIDCRFSLADTGSGRKEYLSEHIPGAFYAHLDDDLSGQIIPGITGRHPLPSIDSCESLFSSWGIKSSSQVVVYDQGHGGIASRLWWMLQWLGHASVAVLNGGWDAWNNRGYPTSTTVPSIHQGQFKAQPHSMPTRSTIEILENIEHQEICVVDSRLHERYLGNIEPIDPVAGHIPGALNAPFPENLNPDGFWKGKEALARRFRYLIGKNNLAQVVFHCGSGVTACHNILAFAHAGLGKAALYPGSWSEWITDAERPVINSKQ
jgi:thiosulfate/3-mercaptopyruvate sulfurtransferase